MSKAMELALQLFGAAKEVMQTAMPGLSLEKIVGDVRDEGNRLMTHGRMEAASALFNGNAFVAYGPGQYVADRDGGVYGSQAQNETQHLEHANDGMSR